MPGVKRETNKEFAVRCWPEVQIGHYPRLGTRFQYAIKAQVVSFNAANRTDKAWSCTCQHGSMWGVFKENELCYHVMVVREAINRRKSFVW